MLSPALSVFDVAFLSARDVVVVEDVVVVDVVVVQRGGRGSNIAKKR